MQGAIDDGARGGRCRRRWGHGGNGCRIGGGTCGSAVCGLGIARVMVLGYLWGQTSSSKRKKTRGKNVRVDEPVALVLTPTCQALFWASGLVGKLSSDVLERGGLGTSGEGTKGVPCTGPGYNEEVGFDLEPPGCAFKVPIF